MHLRFFPALTKMILSLCPFGRPLVLENLERTHASFGIRSDDLVPAEISSLLHLTPRRSWAKGDLINTRSGVHPRPWGIWSISTDEAVTSPEMEKHIFHLLNILEPRAQSVKALLERKGTAVN